MSHQISNQMIYGINPVRESLLAEKDRIDKIYLLPNKESKVIDELRFLAKRQNIALRITKRDQLDRMAGTEKHQGVVALRSSGAYYDLDELLEKANRSSASPFLFLMDGVEDPRNLGAIIRTVDAVGGDGIIIPSRRAVGLTPVVSKTSSGALAHLPVVRVSNLSPTIDRLKKAGIWVVGLDIHGKMSYVDYDFTGPTAIVIGGEGKGIRQKILERCDETVSLPMLGHVASLNVAIAVGVVAYEVVRQRRLSKK
ncbi:23S rRNA (guanosine(2251)-2'-O)-methyltransferase RlmB [Nitrospira defluvii]|nr:23S rRNA (guanosine(2251)-2'-O)-methyltransferase RlmB [Nitrospira defluvii]